MTDESDKRPEPKQTTSKGVEIPVPTREDFMRDLRKVAPKPKPPARDDKPEKG